MFAKKKPIYPRFWLREGCGEVMFCNPFPLGIQAIWGERDVKRVNECRL
jgi:hypothetical protein